MKARSGGPSLWSYPKAEPAARQWLVRYLSEGTPTMRDVAKVTASLAGRKLEADGLELGV